ncbi:MAG TPA: NADH-quinone oxidoreductase subunit L [Acidimicrobiaceae bacterium]|nr:NADH-quinone oxidoreductase subunit L [Acidimicrobiaceae bacterium]
MTSLVWLIPGFPLIGFTFLLIFGRRLGEPQAGWLATATVSGSFLSALAVFFGLATKPPEERVYEITLFEWIPSGELSVGMGFLADPLSIAMALFVTGVGALIHMYAIGYMHGDPKFSKFFLYLNLFVFAMLMLVLGDNLLITFLGWEGVGACSYFLISFWHEEPANATAGKKAFVTNRVGDWGFMVAMFLLFFNIGSLKYSDIFSSIIEADALTQTTATAIVAMLFIGAAGKSAQFPLYLWLPDAMAGPTPVSALIHAATMVTSGVYLLTRMNPVLAEAAGWSTDLIWIVGLFTALFAATAAVAQNDIKKVLAYSTVSQLGFMFVAVGSGLYVAAIFHMITHAFFKALLFLGAGSVIHGMHHEQDMRKYGALRKAMPITAFTFIIGWLAIAGIPPFSGFWSKDEVLLAAWNENKIAWVMLLAAAVMTAFYMSRLVFMTFFGEKRWGTAATEEEAHESETEKHEIAPHESPMVMWLPLVLLSGLAAIAGLLNLPFSHDTKHLEKWLEPILFGNEVHVTASGQTKWLLAVIAIIGASIGVIAAIFVYLKNRVATSKIEHAILEDAWRFDSTVSSFMGGPGRKSFEATTWFDQNIIDGAVNGVGKVTQRVSTRLRGVQTGLIRSYALGMVIGAVAIIAYFISRMGF